MDTIQKYVDKALPPNSREKFAHDKVEFAKHSPLLSSFLTTQFTFSSIPVGIFAIFAISTLLLSVGAALIFSAIVIGSALFFLLPILFVTTSTATVVWASTVSFYVISNWLYESLYKDSSVDIQLKHTRANALKLKREIDQNGTEEAGYYVNGVKDKAADVSNGVKQITNDGIDTVQQNYNNVKDTAQSGYGQLKDSANATSDHVQRTAYSAKDSVLKDDGVVDGVKAKGNRLGNNMKESPLAYDAKDAKTQLKTY